MEVNPIEFNEDNSVTKRNLQIYKLIEGWGRVWENGAAHVCYSNVPVSWRKRFMASDSY